MINGDTWLEKEQKLHVLRYYYSYFKSEPTTKKRKNQYQLFKLMRLI